MYVDNIKSYLFHRCTSFVNTKMHDYIKHCVKHDYELHLCKVPCQVLELKLLACFPCFSMFSKDFHHLLVINRSINRYVRSQNNHTFDLSIVHSTWPSCHIWLFHNYTFWYSYILKLKYIFFVCFFLFSSFLKIILMPTWKHCIAT